jgi:hypothetical protein
MTISPLLKQIGSLIIAIASLYLIVWALWCLWNEDYPQAAAYFAFYIAMRID